MSIIRNCSFCGSKIDLSKDKYENKLNKFNSYVCKACIRENKLKKCLGN